MKHLTLNSEDNQKRCQPVFSMPIMPQERNQNESCIWKKHLGIGIPIV